MSGGGTAEGGRSTGGLVGAGDGEGGTGVGAVSTQS